MRIIAASLIVFVIALCALFIIDDVPTVQERPPTRVAIVESGEPTVELITRQDFAHCVQSIAELPEAPELFNREDPRLRGTVIVVMKRARRLMLMRAGQIGHDRSDAQTDCWRVALGIDRQGRSTAASDKLVAGDHRTPEGWFRTSDKPWSQYKNAVAIHFPDERHASRGLGGHLITQGLYEQILSAQARAAIPPQNTKLGGEILIHGGGSNADWTWGCIALNDNDLEELRSLLPAGMRSWILILP